MHDETDMRRMGGLRKYMPVTFATYVVGWLAIIGFPGLAGFWSKDGILGEVYKHGDLGRVLWIVAVLTAGLTAFYMTRQVFLVFFGPERFDPEELHPHESPPAMLLPLVALAGLSLVGGGLNLPIGHLDYLGRWLEPVVPFELEVKDAQFYALLFAGVGASLLGFLLAFVLYFREEVVARGRVLVTLPLQTLHAFLRNKWLIDDAYGFVFAGAGGAGAAFLAYVVDARIVDGAVNGVGVTVRESAGLIRRLQSGYVRNYALGIFAGAVLISGFLLFRSGVG
jgi:NADH-quinone oxidoreductase subunit L